MIFSDIDGTLTSPEKSIRPLRKSVQKTIQLGIPFAFATGRVYLHSAPDRNLELVHPQIASNGAEIIDPNTNEHIFHETLGPRYAGILLDICPNTTSRM